MSRGPLLQLNYSHPASAWRGQRFPAPMVLNLRGCRTARIPVVKLMGFLQLNFQLHFKRTATEENERSGAVCLRVVSVHKQKEIRYRFLF